MQEIYRSDEKFEELKRILPKGAKCLVVGGSAYKRSMLRQTVEEWLAPVLFDGYSPNPKAEEIKEGVRLFQREKCACILAVGGGSAIDTAKAIKYYSGDSDTDFLSVKPDREAQTLPLVAVPTTAGTGAESTRYSIFYRDGKKTSLDHPCCLPDEALLWEGWLERLPLRQKVSTMLDALCQAIESYWAVASNEQSGALALLAIRKIMSFGDDYILRPYDKEVAWEIMEASSLAGQAIQITRTTAPHAMAYALTTEYGVPHGEAVALNLPGVWERMLLSGESNDERGREAVIARFDKIAAAMGAGSVSQAIELFRKKLVLYGVKAPFVSERDAPRLVASVNVERLSNNPLKLSVQDLGIIYKNL